MATIISSYSYPSGSTYTYSSSGLVLADPTQNPVSITTTGKVEGSSFGILGESSYDWTIVNSGTVGAGASGTGIQLDAGGSIANTGSPALISGGQSGVLIAGGAGSVSNEGTISGGQSGVFFAANAANTLANAGTISGGSDAVYFKYGNDRVVVEAGAVFVGDVSGGSGGNNTLELASATSGTLSFGGGVVTGVAGTTFDNFTNIAVDSGANWSIGDGSTIVSGQQLGVSGSLGLAGTLTVLGEFENTGTLAGAGTLFVDPGTLINSGSVGVTVTLDGGSYLDNTGSGTINVAGTAVYGDTNGADRVTNSGTIIGSGVGIYLADGGYVYNTGTITGSDGIYATGGSYLTSITNFGTITGTENNGIELAGSAPGTVVNFGTIGGDGDAILFGGGDDRLVVEPGAVFYGAVDGGGGTNTLELATSGTLTLFGSSVTGPGETTYLNFATVVIDSYLNSTVYGSGAQAFTLDAGAHLYNYSTAVATGTAVYGTFDGAVSVTNGGTIEGTGGSGVGVYLGEGGSVDNTGAASYIGGSQYGIEARFGTAYVINYGTIEGRNGDGVYLRYGGSVANIGAATYIYGGQNGIRVVYGDATVANAGTISGGDGEGYAILFGSGDDRLIVYPGAQFIGTVDGGAGFNTLELASATDTTGALSGLGSRYINFANVVVDPGANWNISGTLSGGTLTNYGTISEYSALTLDGSTLINDNYIGSLYAYIGNLYAPVSLANGSYLDNSGTIAAPYNSIAAVYVTGANPSSIANFGLIENGDGTAGAGVYLAAGGNIYNAGTITGYNGIQSAVAAGSYIRIDNFGTITGTGNYGIDLADTNNDTVVNYGTITGSDGGIYLANGGTVINSGAAAYIYGDRNGIEFGAGSGTVINYGTIGGSDGGDAILFGNGDDRLVVEPGAVFYGAVDGGGGTNTLELATSETLTFGYGAIIGPGETTYLNFATVVIDSYLNSTVYGSGAQAFTLNAGAHLYNYGTVAAPGIAVCGTFYGPASVTNSGTIEGTGDSSVGIYLGDGGSVANIGAASYIYGARYGIEVGFGAATVANAGTIGGGEGSDAVLFGSYDDRLILYPGAYFNGTVDGGGGTNTIELASAAGTGTLNGLGSEYLNFSQIAIDGGAQWVIGGSPTIGSFSNSGSVTFNGSPVFTTLVNGGTLGGSGTLIIDPGTMTNTGLVTLPVALDTGSSLDNTSTGTITITGGNAVTGTGGSITVANAGTITATGGAAVQLAGGNNRVIVAPGAVFGGLVDGGSGAVLELASGGSEGTIGGIGTAFVDFASVVVDGGARWALSGSDTVAGTIAGGGTLEVLAGAAVGGTIGFGSAGGTLQIDGASLPTAPNFVLGATIGNFVAGDTIDLTGVAFDPNGTVTLATGNVLQITEQGRTYDLQLNASQSFTGRFKLASDGRGGTDITAGAILTPPAPPSSYPLFDADWTIAGIGDVTGNGAADLVWLNGQTNLVEIELQIAGVPVGGGTIVNNAFDSTWKVSAVGDFNGDRLSDLVYRRSDGLSEVQFLNGDTAIGGGVIANNPFDTTWNIVATGDFNGDRDSDLVWQQASGLTEIQFLNGNTATGGGAIVNNPFDTSWKIVATGDFNRDGDSDLVWQNQSSGVVEIQFLSGSTAIGGGAIVDSPFDATWKVVGAGDFLGNGSEDLVYQRPSDGVVEVQYLNGITPVGGGVVDTSFGAGWQVVGVGDFNGDGKADLLFRNTGSQITEVQLLNGIAPAGGGLLALGH